MANFNITADTNWDTLSGGSTNATLDTYVISNGATLTIDTDSYQCANHSAAFGSVDTVSYSGIGGRFRISGNNVRVIPYNTGTGNVPTIGATITQGGVSAVFLGVWSSWLVEPTASGPAMPASGFIKVKNKTGGNFAAGALSGIGATSTGADVVGWIEVRGADTATITVPRVGAFEIVGDWFQLGTTNGSRGQVLACPTSATVAGVFGGVWIETGVGTGVYERFAGVGSMVNLAGNPTDERGKVVWQTTSGIRIGSDGTNNVGFLPPTGCRVRIPNVILTCCTRTAGSGSGPRVLPNSGLGTRQEFITTNAGDIQINNAVVQWYMNFAQAFKADMTNSVANDTIVLSEISSPLNLNNVIVSPTQAQLNVCLAISSCFGGGTIQDVLAARFSLAASGAYVNSVTFSKGITFNNVKSQTLLNRGNATTGTWTTTQNSNCTWSNCTDIGGRQLHTTNVNCTISTYNYADNFSGTTGTGNAHYAVDMASGCNGITINGVAFLGLTNVHPYNGVAQATASYNITIRNIGTFASPLNLGSANASGLLFNGNGNNDTIRIQRCYVSNTRTNPWAFLNSDNNVTLESVFGDYADTAVIASLNTIAKGVALTGATTGQVSVYGTHFKDSFTSTTVGKIEVLCNEPTSLTASQVTNTGGTPRWNSSGQLALTSIGDEVTWEFPYFILGHTALANIAPTLTGTNTGNIIVEFQWNTGTGYSAWQTLNAANQNAVGAINPATGIRLKIRARCTSANAGNLLTNIAIPTTTTSAAQSTNLYPLDTITLTLTGLQTATDIVILNAGTETELVNVDANAGTSYAYIYSTAGVAVDIGLFKTGFVPYYIRNYTLSSSNVSLPVSQVVDRNYNNP